MNRIIFWTVTTAVVFSFLVWCVVDIIYISVKCLKCGKRICVRKYRSIGIWWYIAFAILHGLKAITEIYGLKDCTFTESVLGKIKIVCFLLIFVTFIFGFFLQTRAYITEKGIITAMAFLPVSGVKYSVKTEYDEYIIDLYTKKEKPSYTFCTKKENASEMLENFYEKADGTAAKVKIKSLTIQYLLIILCTSLIAVVGTFSWYENKKPFIFVKNIIVPTDTEWAMFCDAGYFDLMFTNTVNYYDDLNGKRQEMWDNRYDLQNLTPEDIVVLKELPNLKHLDVIASDIDDLTTIGELTQLEGLAIGGGKMFAKPTDYSPLKNLTKLKYFIGYGLYNFNDMTVLENADDLAYFELTYADIQSGLDVICEKENLLVLGLYSCTAEDFSPIGNCSRLKWLSLYEINVDDLSFLKNLKELEYLDIRNIKAEDYSVLLELPKLNKIYAKNTDIPNYIVNELAEKGIEVYCKTED